MLPTLVQIGGFQLSSFGVFLGLGFIFATFVVWQGCRDRGLTDEKVLDTVVVTTAFTLIGARIGFVLSHWSLFAPQLLRIFVIWRFPGLSVWGAIFLGLLGFTLMTKSHKLPFSVLFDSLGRSFPVLLFFISIAIYLDGTIVGKPSTLPWSVPVAGVLGRRHPIGFYGVILAVLNFFCLWGLEFYLKRKGSKIPGTSGWVAFLLLGLSLLLLAILRTDLLYLGGVAVEVALSVIVIFTSLVPTFYLLAGKRGKDTWNNLKLYLQEKAYWKQNLK